MNMKKMKINKKSKIANNKIKVMLFLMDFLFISFFLPFRPIPSLSANIPSKNEIWQRICWNGFGKEDKGTEGKKIVE